MAAAGFNPTELNKYLSEKNHNSLWDRISRTTGAELDTLLLDAELHRLMQYRDVPAAGQEAAARCQEVRNAVAKQSTGRFAGTANTVRVGLDHLNGQPPRHNPASLALWEWYFPSLTQRSEQQVNDAVSAMLTHYEARGVADLEDLSRRLGNRGLDPAAQEEVLGKVLAYGLRVVRPLDRDVISRLDGSTAPNIVALLRPATWAADSELSYSAYDAAPTGQAPVGKQDVEEAVSYFDTHRQQEDKNAVNKLGSVCATDQELQDAVLAYHLAKVLDAAQHGVPAETVMEFRNRGLIEVDARRLLGQNNATGSGEPTTRPTADPAEEKSDYGMLEKLLDQWKTRAAREYHQALESAHGKPVTGYGRDIALRVNRQNTEADNHLYSAQQAFAAGDLPLAQAEIRVAAGLCLDDDTINELHRDVDNLLYQQRVEQSDRDYYTPALAAVADRQLIRAGELLAAAEAAGAETTATGQQATAQHRHARDAVTGHTQSAEQALAQGNLLAAHHELDAARQLAEDIPEVNDLWQRVQQEQFDQQIIDRELSARGYQPITSPRYQQVALLPATTTWLRHLPFLFLPAAVLDFLVFHTVLADPAPGITLLPWILAAAGLAWLLQGVLSRFARGRGAFLRLIVVLLSLALLLSLAFDDLWFTVAATAALAFNTPRIHANRARAEQISEWNEFNRRFRAQAQEEGLLHISVDAEGRTVFPQATRVVVSQAEHAPGDLQLRDSAGAVLSKLPWQTRQALINDKLLVEGQP